MAFKIGAGSIRAYPHAENTGLVISDGAKIGRNLESSKYLSHFLQLFTDFKQIGDEMDYAENKNVSLSLLPSISLTSSN